MTELESVVLYRAARPYWLVDAKLDDRDGLSICSGDANAEWFIRVLPDDLDRLRALLEARLERIGGSGVMRGTVSDLPRQPLLLLLLENFGHLDDNPFASVKDFLKESRVPFDTDFWGSM